MKLNIRNGDQYLLSIREALKELEPRIPSPERSEAKGKKEAPEQDGRGELGESKERKKPAKLQNNRRSITPKAESGSKVELSPSRQEAFAQESPEIRIQEDTATAAAEDEDEDEAADWQKPRQGHDSGPASRKKGEECQGRPMAAKPRRRSLLRHMENAEEMAEAATTPDASPAKAPTASSGERRGERRKPAKLAIRSSIPRVQASPAAGVLRQVDVEAGTQREKEEVEVEEEEEEIPGAKRRPQPQPQRQPEQQKRRLERNNSGRRACSERGKPTKLLRRSAAPAGKEGGSSERPGVGGRRRSQTL